MANFHIAKEFTKDLEGGFWNDPSAGWTYAGITRNNYPGWPGWRRLLQLQKERFKGAAIPRYTIFKDAELIKLVDDFYRATFWNKYIKGDAMQAQQISNFIYDFVVHKQNAAIAVINATALAIDKTITVKPAEISFDVIGIINKFPRSFYTNLYTNRINYYKNNKKFSQAVKNAFVARAKKFPEFLTNI